MTALKLSLPSNHGNSELSISLNSKSEYAHDAGYESSVNLTTRYWDGDHDHPASLHFNGLWLRRDDLLALQKRLADWVNQPLTELATSKLIAEFELARLPGQRLALLFGPREDTIDERHPVLTVKLKLNSLKADFHFVTDQSCLALFADELSKV